MQLKHLIPVLLLCASCGRPETVEVEVPEPVSSLPPVAQPEATPQPTFSPSTQEVTPEDRPEATPTPTPTPSVTPTPTPTGSPSHADPYAGDYNVVTMQLVKDACGGSCGQTFDFPATTVVGTEYSSYTANGMIATPGADRLSWTATRDPHISTCEGSVETDTWDMSPRGEVREFQYEIQGGCQGGVQYDCLCKYSN